MNDVKMAAFSPFTIHHSKFMEPDYASVTECHEYRPVDHTGYQL